MESGFRNLPSVDKLLGDERIDQLKGAYPHPTLVSLVRQHLDQLRLSIGLGNPCPSFDEIVGSICQSAQTLGQPGPRQVINASGVILHTNLGRAPLGEKAIAAMELAAKGYTNLEFELTSGRRGSRQVHIESLLCQVTGAEAALVVNNNASSVLLALSALAKGREVIVSRGQAVEIGGGFRIPDVMRQSGAKLVEVGTTNCTYLADYEQAITPKTAALLRVHTSNFKVIGFTQTIALEELIQLGDRYGLLILDDLGSGCLLDTTKFGLDAEPMVQDSIASGVGLAFFSGDKLLGGPQAGLIVGKKSLIDRLKKHPLARVVRIDKIRLAGLAATLLSYLKGEAVSSIPVWRMISMPLEEIKRRAEEWCHSLSDLASVVAGESMVGGGSLPGSTLPTMLVAFRKQGKEGKLAQELAQNLRCQQPPVVGRIERNVLLLDPRTVLPEQDEAMLQALRSALRSLPGKGRLGEDETTESKTTN